MSLKALADELERELNRVVWNKAFIPRLINTIIPIVARNYIPEFVWVVEEWHHDLETADECCDSIPRYFTTSVAKIGHVFRTGELVKNHQIHEGYADESHAWYEHYCYAVYRFRTLTSDCECALVQVYDALGRKIDRKPRESDNEYLVRAVYTAQEVQK